MKKIESEFVSDDSRSYPFHLGKTKASALSGFIAGAILASIIWFAAAFLIGFFK